MSFAYAKQTFWKKPWSQIFYPEVLGIMLELRGECKKQRGTSIVKGFAFWGVQKKSS